MELLELWKACPACQAAGRNPKNFADPRRCAFPDGSFNSDNWNCATANALRGKAEGKEVWTDDQSAALLPWNGRFIVLGWYKSRGRTEYLGWLDGTAFAPLTLAQAQAYLAAALE